MNAKYRVLWISLFVIALFAGLSATRAQTMAKADVVTANTAFDRRIKCVVTQVPAPVETQFSRRSHDRL